MKKPTYQTNLPPQVRYDQKLPANAKLLYGEIKALCDQQGYCWASNHYLATLYGVQAKVVSRWIHQLRQREYIRNSKLPKGTNAKSSSRAIYSKGIAHPPFQETASPQK